MAPITTSAAWLRACVLGGVLLGGCGARMDQDSPAGAGDAGDTANASGRGGTGSANAARGTGSASASTSNVDGGGSVSVTPAGATAGTDNANAAVAAGNAAVAGVQSGLDQIAVATGVGGEASGIFCIYGGEAYSPREVIHNDEECEECGCRADGSLDCGDITECGDCKVDGITIMALDSFTNADWCDCYCEPPNLTCFCPYPSDCVYAGEAHSQGSEFPARDGCNTCTCEESGVQCTQEACACDTASEWYRDYVGLSPDECATLDFDCPPSTAMFNNECGCGCEQGVQCPEWLDCHSFDEPCNECPYSK